MALAALAARLAATLPTDADVHAVAAAHGAELDRIAGTRVVAASYGASLQLDVLGLDVAALAMPILDVGCGPGGVLVAALRARGLDATGVDRYIDEPGSRADLVLADWDTFAYPPSRFGTIVSHLALSLHFLHHHAAGDAAALAGARTFAAITRALAPGGVLAYVPGLPMLERALDRAAFEVTRRPLPAELEAGLAPLSAAVGEDVAYAALVRRR